MVIGKYKKLKIPAHGTRYRYTGFQCRCKKCREANAAYQRVRIRKTAETKKTDNPVVAMIHQAKPNLIARLPQGIDRDRFFLGILTAIQKSKANSKEGQSLADCDPNSVLLAAYDAAEVGCSLSPSLQLGWLINYGGQAQFQPSYRFFIQKAYETGEVKTFYAECVYACDKFERQFAPKRNLFHAPVTDGTVDWEYLTTEQIERHRNHSKQPNSMKWMAFFEEGFRITPIRVIAKRLPLKNRNLEGLVEIVNRDAERDLDIAVDQILEPSIPRRMPETEKPAEKSEPAAVAETAATEKPKEEPKPASKEPEKAAAASIQANATPAGSMFAEGDQDPYVTPAEIQDFWNKAFGANWKKPEVVKFIKETYKVEALKDMRKSQLASALDSITQARE